MRSLATTFLIFVTCIVVAGTLSLVDRAQKTLSASAGSNMQAGANAASVRDAATLAEFAAAAQEKLRLAPPDCPVAFDDLRPSDPNYAAAQAVYPFLHRRLVCPECALSSAFSPKNALTRAQAAVVLVGILAAQERISLLTPEQTDEVLNNVPDAGSVSVFAQPYIATALADGLLVADSDNMVRPTQPYSHAEMTTVFGTIQRRFPPSATTASLQSLHLASGGVR